MDKKLFEGVITPMVTPLLTERILILKVWKNCWII